MAYDEHSIKILEGLEAVRKRPGMYIGSTDKRGMHHLVWEIVDNSIDEIINGYGDTIKIVMHKDGSITVSDNGRGVPIGMHESGKSTPEVIYTVLHAGGKFENAGYKVSGGLHGVGGSVVNALSTYMEVTICREGKISQIEFEKGGHVKTPLHQIGETKKTGTTVTFLPDKEIFKNCNFSFTTICERMQESAFLLSNVTIEIIDEEDNLSNKYHYENGIISFVEYINENKAPLSKVIHFDNVKSKIEVDIAMQYTDSYNEQILSFVNNVKTSDGGTHEVGFKTGITKAFNDYVKNNNVLKGKDVSLDGSDVREGLTAVISVKIPEELLQFEGQTKGKLGTPEARSAVEGVTYESLKFFLEENKDTALSILEKAQKSKMAREAARKARESVRKGTTKSNKERVLSEKLAKATGKNFMKNELFLVEGDSAGGSAKDARIPKTQAILPLRGKILNVEKARLDRALANEEIRTIITAFGTGIGDDFDLSKLRYHKIIIMTDADVDGDHIRILLLTLFYRFFRPIVEAGHVYAAQPPLYKVVYGKTIKYVQTDEELAEYRASLPPNAKPIVNRFKGLGEMDAIDLRNTTMHIENRVLKRITVEDTMAADQVFSDLMGDDVSPRKTFIEENARFAENLDI